MKCSNCGGTIPNDSKFCPFCGSAVGQDQVSQVLVAPEAKQKGKKRVWIWVLIAALVLLAAGGGAYYYLGNSSVDKSFIRDFEQGILERNQGAENLVDADILVNQEWALLSKYQDAEFKDKGLQDLAQTYLLGLQRQKEHLIHDDEADGHCYYDSDDAFYDTMIVRCSAIKYLHDSYGVLSTHEDLVQKYTTESLYWSELKKAEESLQDQLIGKYTDVFDGRIPYLPYTNKTGSRLDLTIHSVYELSPYKKYKKDAEAEENIMHFILDPGQTELISFSKLTDAGITNWSLYWDIDLPDYKINRAVRARA